MRAIILVSVVFLSGCLNSTEGRIGKTYTVQSGDTGTHEADVSTDNMYGSDIGNNTNDQLPPEKDCWEGIQGILTLKSQDYLFLNDDMSIAHFVLEDALFLYGGDTAGFTWDGFFGRAIFANVVDLPDTCSNQWDVPRTYEGASSILDVVNLSELTFEGRPIAVYPEGTPCYSGILIFKRNDQYGAIKVLEIENHEATIEYWYGEEGVTDFSKPHCGQPNFECMVNSECDEGNECTSDYCIDNKCIREDVKNGLSGNCTVDDGPGWCRSGECLPAECHYFTGPEDCDDGDPATKDYCGNQGLCRNERIDTT